jgi:cell division septation protein DedD
MFIPTEDWGPALITMRGARWALDGRGQEIQDHHPERARLTAAQAAAVLSVLTDGNCVSVINGPTGSGEDAGDDRSRPHQGRIWAAAGRGPVIGITPARSARSTWAAGVAGSQAEPTEPSPRDWRNITDASGLPRQLDRLLPAATPVSVTLLNHPARGGPSSSRNPQLPVQHQQATACMQVRRILRASRGIGDRPYR